MKKSNSYWSDRANLRMGSYHKNSDETVYKINNAYDKAIEDINSDIKKIFFKFQSDSGLSIQETKAMLNSKIPSRELEIIRSKINGIEDVDLKRTLMSQLNANAYKARITRLEALKENIRVNTTKVADVQLKQGELSYINSINNAYYKNIYDIQKGVGLGFDFSHMLVNRIEEMLKNNWSGKHYSERVWGNSQVLAEKLEETITAGLMSGKSSRRMALELAELSEYGKMASERLIRTETTYISNAAELESYKECGIDKYVFVATLDLRTSTLCREHDGKIVDVSKGVPGENLPPLHPWCRSTTIAYMGAEWYNNLKRRARDPDTGKTYTVPGNMRYDEWYKQHVVDKYGEQKAETFQKMIRNKASDRKQHSKYKEILGKEVSKSFANFQELKYNDKENWERLSYKYKLETVYNLDRLKHTENFASKGAIKHILEGEVNKRGKAVGFHMENMPTKKGKIIEDTRSEVNDNGIYRAKVIIDGVSKMAKSTFFPTDMTPQQIVNAINEAYTNKKATNRDEFVGNTSYGFGIGMYFNDNGKITTAYPKF